MIAAAATGTAGEAERSIAEIVANDLCVGCGLCEALTGGRVKMVMTPAGSLRPSSTDAFSRQEEAQLMAACPGAVGEARVEDGTDTDLVWGAHRWMAYAWAGRPDTRHRAATGGVLTALGVHVLRTGRADFVLHVGADPDRPMRSRWILSEDPESVRANTSSRYGPTAPLAGLAEFGLKRTTWRCSATGATAIRDRPWWRPPPGKRFTKSYLEMWEDESGWDVETRCKLCPDALGEAADVAAADVWPGGAPTGEDAGFNGIIVRTAVGEDLVASAVEAGELVLGDPIAPREFDALQPHQVRKKEPWPLATRGWPTRAPPPSRQAACESPSSAGESTPRGSHMSGPGHAGGSRQRARRLEAPRPTAYSSAVRVARS